MTGSSSDKRGAAEVASLVFRIATVGLSLASAITTATATQCAYDDAGRPAATVSYGDYPSLRYAAVADLVSAVLQGVAIYLEAVGRKKAAKTVELIDKLVLALTWTSTALLLAVDEITSCGPPGARRGRDRRPRSACDQAGAFCGRLQVSSVLSLAGAMSVSATIYTRRVPEAVPTITITTPEPSITSDDDNSTTTSEDQSTNCLEITDDSSPPPPSPSPPTLPVAVVPPWRRSPRPTIPCPCNSEQFCARCYYSYWLP